MKKSVTSFIAVMLIIIFLGVTAVTGVYIPGGWTMPFRNTATSDTSATDTSDTSSTDSSADKADNKADSTDASADTSADSASTDSADTTDSGLKAIIPSVLDTDNGIRLGLDLVGGSRIVYEAEIPDGYDTNNLSDDMNSVQKVIRQRLTDKGFTEATVSLSGENRVTVEIPQITNPEEAVQTLGTTAQLTFLDADGKEWLSGSDIKKASYGYGNPTNGMSDQHYVEVQFTSEGRKKFAEATGSVAARTDGTNILYIMMDKQIISYPSVSEKIDNDSCVITGNFTRDSATELANLINAGQIPFSLKQVELRSVGPQLGADAMSSSLKAGMIGLLLVMLFMIIMYRIPGVVSCFALCFYMVIEALLFSLIRVNLSLPGIAGIILSIGMAVDANVIVFARIREELATGKTVKSAMQIGYDKALSAIIDGNVTTLIAAAVLWLLGPGTVKGFAQTLALGIVLSMFTALVVTKYIMKAFYALGLKDPKWYGVGKEHKTVNFLGKKGIFFGLSLAVILAGFITMGVYKMNTGDALNYSLEFKGGTATTVTFDKSYTLEEINSEMVPLIESTTGSAVQIQTVQGSNEVIFKTGSLDVDQRQALNQMFVDNFGVDETLITSETISSTISNEMKSDTILAVAVAIICMLIYIRFRFSDIRFGVSSIACLLHDVLVVITFYALARVSVSNTFIACLLTIVGYSINATIVIFDRVRENMAVMTKKDDLQDVVNHSITQTLSRSLFTSLTTLVMVGALYIWGVTSIRDFALPLMVGIICGAYSSVCIAGALWYVLRKKFAPKAK